MKTKVITLDFVNNNFYEYEGKVYRKDGRKCRNTMYKNGYYTVYFKYKNYSVHRILWILYHQQEIPEGMFIDHVDNCSTNNSKENLRLATHSENQHNRKIQKNNTSGIKGINIKKDKGCFYYSCEINKNNKKYSKIYPYTSEGLELAKNWIEEKRKELHGDFLRNK